MKLKKEVIVSVLIVFLIAICLAISVPAAVQSVRAELPEKMEAQKCETAGYRELVSAPPASNVNASLPEEKPQSANIPMDRNNDGIIQILLTGVDNNNIGGLDELGNADGTLIVTINENTKQIVMASILRDTVFPRASDPNETNKITLLYHYYGFEEYYNSLESGMELSFDNYVRFNFLDIIDIVDSLGGIDMELYSKEIAVANKKLQGLNTQLLGLEANDGLIEETEGIHHLDGKQTVAFMRVRISDDSNNDIGRTERDRRVVLALKDKVLALNAWKQLTFIQKIIGLVEETDFTLADAAGYALKLNDYKDYSVLQCVIPQAGTYYTSDAYVYMDFEANIAFLNEIMHGATD